ncbi:MAG TPA: helix-turn-helix transcriptional regulator [Solirubrobacterales bacterium]|nr:helix-turn-helix transcriptional regulator [Solirubrobacterales bacterium]
MKSKSIRLTSTSYALLALLDQLGEATPYEIKQAMDKSIENFWPVPHTTAYDEPARLASGGYLSVSQEEGGRRRKTYALTAAGREALSAWAADPEAAAPQLRDETILKIFAGADPRAFLEPRRTWHREKLAELEGYLEETSKDEAWRRSAMVLTAGVAYHRKMLEMLDELTPADDGKGG